LLSLARKAKRIQGGRRELRKRRDAASKLVRGNLRFRLALLARGTRELWAWRDRVGLGVISVVFLYVLLLRVVEVGEGLRLAVGGTPARE
jgi:hypothetical protein